MIKTKIIKVEKEEEETEQAFCDFCGSEFDERTTKCNGFGQIGFSFGFGSCFDDEHYSVQICDNCFMERFSDLLGKQLSDKCDVEKLKIHVKEHNNVLEQEDKK